MARPRKSYLDLNSRTKQYSQDEMLHTLTANLTKQIRKPNLLGYDPHEKQLLFHQSQSRNRLYIGGNQSGKTTGGAVEDLYWLRRRHPFRAIPDIPIHGRAIAVDFQSVNKVLIGTLDDSGIRRWMVPSDLINGSWEDSYNSNERTLTLSNGSTLEFKSYDQEVLQHAGRSLHFVHFDEPPPKALYTENNIRTVARYGDFPGSGSWWMTYTPIFGMDWTYDEIYLPGKEDSGQSGIEIIEVDMDDNPYLSEEAKSKVLNGLSEDDIEARKRGRYVQMGGNVFKEFGAAHCINEADLYEIWGGPSLPAEWELYWSIDHGLNAPTAIYWHGVSPDGTIVTFREIYKAEQLVKDHAAEVHRIEKEIDRTPYFRTGDPAIKQRNAQTGTSIQQAYAELGIWINVDSVPKDGSIGIIKMRQHMRINPLTQRPYWMILDTCPSLIKELGRIHWKVFASMKTRDDNNPMEQVHKHNDHAFDSCKYFFTFMPDLKPVLNGVVQRSDFDQTSLIYNRSNQPIEHVPGPINMNGWSVTRYSEDQDELGYEGNYYG